MENRGTAEERKGEDGQTARDPSFPSQAHSPAQSLHGSLLHHRQDDVINP